MDSEGPLSRLHTFILLRFRSTFLQDMCPLFFAPGSNGDAEKLSVGDNTWQVLMILSVYR